jgi:hypothetical protein
MRGRGGAVRFYLKLFALTCVFLALWWLRGEVGRDHVYEVSFAVRCQVAALSHDAAMEKSLVSEYEERLRAQMCATTRPTTQPIADW